MPPESPNLPVPRSPPRLPVAALIVAIAAAYANSLGVPFVYDDTLAIPENATIRHLWPLTDVLLPQAQGGLTVSGRPILNLSLAINHAISGPNVWSYHVFNLLVHMGSALLLFGIVRRTLPRIPFSHGPGWAGVGSDPTPLAATVAALWALHPLLTQAVTYTVQRAESLMGCLLLLTLYAFIRATERAPARASPQCGGERRWAALAVAACTLGMGTKEVMVVAPVLVLLYDRTFVAGSFRGAWTQRSRLHLALAATWLLLGALVVSTGGNRGGTVGLGVGVPWWAYPATQFKALACYLARTAWPSPLTFEYGTFWVRRAGDILPAAALVLPALAATAIALRHRPVPGFCGAWFFLILAPTSLAPGTIQMIVEHRMYLPLAAVVVLGVGAMQALLGRRARLGFIVAAGALGTLTYQRNHDYRSPLALWADTVAKRPENPRAHDGLAEAYESQGRLADALPHRREALRLQPDESTYHYNLALNLAGQGQLEAAAQAYRASLRLVPGEARTHNNLAILLGQLGDPAGALMHYAETVRLQPGDALYHYNHGVALMRAGRTAEAAAAYEIALRLRPGYADAHFNLGTALVRSGRLADALPHYQQAIQLKPAELEYRIAFGGALLLAQRPNDALAEFRRALEIQPEAVEAGFGLGNALGALRRHEEAIAQYEAVLQRAPHHANTHFKLGNILLDVDRVNEAVPHFEVAARLDPSDAETRQNLGVAYARLERWNEARTAFEAALNLKPDYPEARRNLQQLRTLLGR